MEGLPGRSTETKYARIPLWLYETGVSMQAIAMYGWLHGKYGHYDQTFPSYAVLSRELPVSRSSVVAYIKELEQVGALAVRKRWISARQTTNEYVIAFNEPLSTGGQNTDHPEPAEGGQHTDQADLHESEEGGQHTDRGSQNADPGSQNADPRGSACCLAEEDEVGRRRTEEDLLHPTDTAAVSPAENEEDAEEASAVTHLAEAMSVQGMSLTWNLRRAERAELAELAHRHGIAALVDHARRAWHASSSPPHSVRYFLPGWRHLAPPAESTTRAVQPAMARPEPSTGPAGPPAPTRTSTTDQRVQAGLALAAKYAAQEGP